MWLLQLGFAVAVRENGERGTGAARQKHNENETLCTHTAAADGRSAKKVIVTNPSTTQSFRFTGSNIIINNYNVS